MSVGKSQRRGNPFLLAYSETSNNRLSERRTISVQWTNSMPPIALPVGSTLLSKDFNFFQAAVADTRSRKKMSRKLVATQYLEACIEHS